MRVDGGTVVVTYRMSIHPTRGEIILSGRVPWVIESAFGMSDVLADLEGLDLRSLEISGGASAIEVKLPRPEEPTRVRIGGGPATSS